jgi:hypothetical protein
MAKVIEKNSIKIGKEPVVILPLKEYKKLLKYELEKEYIDKIVKEGLKEKKERKTESLESFLKREYPKLYENYTR